MILWTTQNFWYRAHLCYISLDHFRTTLCWFNILSSSFGSFLLHPGPFLSTLDLVIATIRWSKCCARTDTKMQLMICVPCLTHFHSAWRHRNCWICGRTCVCKRVIMNEPVARHSFSSNDKNISRLS